MTTPKETLVRRIRALLAKTIENGATEAEAMSALAKAQEIMQAHGLDRAAIEAEAFVKQTYSGNRAARRFDWGRELAYGVTMFTGTFGWVDDSGITFAGRESDTIFAYWLIDALDGFVTRMAMGYLTEGGVKMKTKRLRRDYAQPSLFDGGSNLPAQRVNESDHARTNRIRDFALGVCSRVTQRLCDLATHETRQRHDAAKRQLEDEGMRFGRGKSDRGSIGDHNAFSAGAKAGDRATFNQPINGGRGTLAIEKQ